MRLHSQEYSLADLVDRPALSLAIASGRFDARLLRPLLRVEACTDRRHEPIRDFPSADEFIAE